MKLTHKQITKLQKREWDVVNNGNENVKVLKIYKDESLFKEIIDLFDLPWTDDIQLAVIATKQVEKCIEQNHT